jgi:hypothetical protein
MAGGCMISGAEVFRRRRQRWVSVLLSAGSGFALLAACSTERHFQQQQADAGESAGGNAAGGLGSVSGGVGNAAGGLGNAHAGSSNAEAGSAEGGGAIATGGTAEPGGAGGNGGEQGGTSSAGSAMAGASGSGGNSGSGGTAGSGANSGSSGTAGSGANSGSSGTVGTGGNSGSSGTAGSGGTGATTCPVCSSNQYCDMATKTCKAQVCTPNAKTCSGNAVQTCNGTGSGSTLQNCGASQICDPNSISCETPVAGSNWANWPMPNPASAGLPNPASYDTHITGVVIDNVTKLMWQRQASSANYTLASAKTYCDNLSLGGYTDWKVPTRIELISLIDFTRASPPMIDPTTFPSTASAPYWTAAGNSTASGTWVVYFDYGTAGLADPVQNAYNVRCVR